MESNMIETLVKFKYNQPIHNTKTNPETLKQRPAKRIYTVWIVPTKDDQWRMYHCPDCREPVVRYKGDLVAEIPGESPHPYPMEIRCKNPGCGRTLVFEDAIEQVI